MADENDRYADRGCSGDRLSGVGDKIVLSTQYPVISSNWNGGESRLLFK